MAGSILKGFGITLLTLAIVLLVGGLGAAAFGYVNYQENEHRALVNQDDGELTQALLFGGAAGVAAGLVLLLVGIVLNAAGNGRRHRELLRAVARPDALGTTR